MQPKSSNKADTTTENNKTKEDGKPAPRVRPARVFRTLVLTALAALPMKGCSGSRQPPPDRPQEVSQAERDVVAEADDPSGQDAGSANGPDAGAGPEDLDTGHGTVFRGGPQGDASPSGDAGEPEPSEQDGGRVWRGGPGEEHHDDDRDAGTSPDDARRARDDAGRTDADASLPPITAYAVPYPDPRPMPMYGVEPVPDPIPPYGVVPLPQPEYAAPDPGPIALYAAPMPDDDDGPVLRYGVPFAPTDKPSG